MAHGFLSYQDNRGKSGIEKALEDFLEKKFGELKDHVTKERKADDLKKDVKEEAQKALTGSDPLLLKGGNQKQLAAAPLQKMISGTALQKSLPAGPSAIDADIVGGGLATSGFNGKPLRSEGFVSDRIVDIGATDLGVERDIGGDDMFVKRIEPSGGGIGDDGSIAIVQAISRLENTTMGIGAAIQAQTQVQQQIAQTQQQGAEKLGRKSLAAAEEASLEQGGDFSSNAAYMALASQGMGMMTRGGGRGGGPIGGLGGKAAASALGRSVMRRGGARSGKRLGIALGGKMGKGLGKGLGKKLGGKAIGKLAGGALAKSLGKKIPLVGLGLGAVFAAQRALQGDFLGAGLELASGAASTVPGAGTAASVGIDAALMAKDMTAMADGGITDGPVNALIGERGKEGVFPLEGIQGKKTFIQFGEGIMEAQKRNKREFAKLQADGLSEYYDKRDGWGTIIDAIKKILPWVGRGNGNGNGNGSGGGGGDAKVGNDLFSTISGGEGGINSYNTGVAGSQAGYTPPKPISQMTVGQIMDDQAKGSLFAVGKYQIIPGTMKSFVSGAGISRDDVFNEETQDKFKQYVIDQKRPDVGKFLTGAEGATLETAQLELAAEFASVGVPFDMKAGSYAPGIPARDIVRGESLYVDYGGAGNFASIGPDVIAEALEKEKALNNQPEPPEKKEIPEPEEQDLSKSGSRGILRNFGAGTGERIHFMHDGTLHNAFKLNGGGFDLYKGSMRVETKDGQNEDVLDSFLEHVTKGEEDLQSSIQSDTNTGADQLNNLSTETIASAETGGTTIINNYNTTTGGNSSGGDDVLLGSNFDGVGPNPMFATMAFRAA